MLAVAAACDDDNPIRRSVEYRPDRLHRAADCGERSAADHGPRSERARVTTITFNVPRDSSGNVTGGDSATFAIHLNNFPADTPASLRTSTRARQGVPGGVFVNTGLSAAAPIVMGDGTANQTITIRDSTQEQATTVLANPQVTISTSTRR